MKSLVSLARSRLRLSLILVALASIGVVGFAGAGSAFASASGCTFGSSSGNVQTCFSINGTGLFVSDMTASAHVVNSGRTLQECIHGPDAALPLCTPFEFIGPGGTLSIVWPPGRNVPAGTYCARTWRLNSDGSHTLIGEVCFDVHS